MEQFSPEITPQPAPAEKMAWGKFFLDLLETVLLAVLLFLGINTTRVRVDGSSMRPTLQTGEYVLVNRLAYRFGEPQRGDIIVFRAPISPEEDLIKRVIGLPGEAVKIESGSVYVNDAALAEPYIAASPNYSGKWSVPADHLFVLGDNRNDSSDSHSWGLVPIENVIGKAVLIYWPPPEWNLINGIQVANAAP